MFKNFIYLNIACLFFAISIALFFQPHDLVTGGVSGLGIVIYEMFGISVSLFTFITNSLLLIVAYFLISKEFAFKAFLGGVVLLPLYLGLIPVYEVTSDVLLSAIFGGASVGIAITFLLLSNSSSGGTTVTGKLLDKYTYLNFALGCGISDLVVVLIGGYTFGIEPLLYSIIAIFTATVLSNYLEVGFNKKLMVHIISDNYDFINDYINLELPRGTTILNASGGYSKEDKKVIMCVIDTQELNTLKSKIYEIDKKAFVVVNHAKATYGLGFLSFD